MLNFFQSITLDHAAISAAFGLSAYVLTVQFERTFKPLAVAFPPKATRTRKPRAPKATVAPDAGYPAGWDDLKAEVATDVAADKRELVRRALTEWPDTSADAIADHFGVSRHSARALCRGLGRSTKAGHKGNDYEVRGA